MGNLSKSYFGISREGSLGVKSHLTGKHEGNEIHEEGILNLITPV
jgi:hypothetical protein